MMNKKMVNGGKVTNWFCINFSRNVQDSVAKGFCYELAQMCQISGMVWNLLMIHVELLRFADMQGAHVLFQLYPLHTMHIWLHFERVSTWNHIHRIMAPC